MSVCLRVFASVRVCVCGRQRSDRTDKACHVYLIKQGESGVHDGGKDQHQSSGLVSVDAHFHISHALAAFLLCPSPRHIRVEIIMDVHFKPPDLSNYYLTNLGWDYQVHKAVARSVLL